MIPQVHDMKRKTARPGNPGHFVHRCIRFHKVLERRRGVDKIETGIGKRKGFDRMGKPEFELAGIENIAAILVF